MNKELEIASAEIIEIFNLLPEEEVEKIPIKLREFFLNIRDKNYEFKLDANKSLLEQKLTEKTKDIIGMLYGYYWCDEEKRDDFRKTLQLNEIKHQNMLREKYNPDVFSQRKRKK